MDASPTPSSTGHRFAPLTVDNNAGYLWIASILCLIYTFLVMIVRLHMKWKMYGLDDAAAMLATVRDFQVSIRVLC